MTDASVLGGTDGSTTDNGGAGGSGGVIDSGSTANQQSGASALGSDGSTKTWRDSLPDDIRTHPAVSSFKDLEALAKSYIHAQSLVGKKGAVVPSEKSTPEEWKAFYQQIGVPPAEKYEITAPKDYKIPDETLGWFKGIAAENGLLPQQASKVLEAYSKFEADTLKKHEAETAQEAAMQLEGLKKEWGDGFDKNLSSARFVVKELGEDFAKYLNETGLGNDVTLIKAFAKLSKAFGEDKLREGGVTATGQTPEEIQRELDELRANGDTNGLFDSKHPMHKISLQKMELLAKRLTNGR